MKKKTEDLLERHNALLSNLIEIARERRYLDVVNDILRFQHEEANQSMAAREFSLQDAISAFGLRHSSTVSFSEPRVWKIEEIPETRNFEPSPCLTTLLENYSRNFDRTSEAMCRTVLDFILNECLTAAKTNIPPPSSASQTSIASRDQATDRSVRTPPPSQDIKVFGEVSFSHVITPAHQPSLSCYSGVMIKGRVDHGIGRTITSHHKRLFQSLLLLVEAKTVANIGTALSQLVVYLGCLHQSRLSRNRSDATVFGVASDGYLFAFVTITHEGVLKRTKQFDTITGPEELVTVLGCLKYLLEKSATMTPNLTPEANSGDLSNVDGGEDPAMDLDDNEFMYPALDDVD